MCELRHGLVLCVLHIAFASVLHRCLAVLGEVRTDGERGGISSMRGPRHRLDPLVHKNRSPRQPQKRTQNVRLSFVTNMTLDNLTIKEHTPLHHDLEIMVSDADTGSPLSSDETKKWYVIASLEIVSSIDPNASLTGQTESPLRESMAHFANLAISSFGTFNLVFRVNAAPNISLVAKNIRVEKIQKVHLKVIKPSQFTANMREPMNIQLFEESERTLIQKLNWRGLQWRLKVTHGYPLNQHTVTPCETEVDLSSNPFSVTDIRYGPGVYMPLFEVRTTNNEYRISVHKIVNVLLEGVVEHSNYRESAHFTLTFQMSSGADPYNATLFLLNRSFKEMTKWPLISDIIKSDSPLVDGTMQVNFTAAGDDIEFKSLISKLCSEINDERVEEITANQSFQLVSPILWNRNHANCADTLKVVKAYKSKMKSNLLMFVVVLGIALVAALTGVTCYGMCSRRKREQRHELHRREQAVLASIHRRETVLETSGLDGAALAEQNARMHKRIQDAKTEMKMQTMYHPEWKRLSSHPLDRRSFPGRPSITSARLSVIYEKPVALREVTPSSNFSHSNQGSHPRQGAESKSPQNNDRDGGGGTQNPRLKDEKYQPKKTGTPDEDAGSRFESMDKHGERTDDRDDEV